MTSAIVHTVIELLRMLSPKALLEYVFLWSTKVGICNGMVTISDPLFVDITVASTGDKKNDSLANCPTVLFMAEYGLEIILQ